MKDCIMYNNDKNDYLLIVQLYSDIVKGSEVHNDIMHFLRVNFRSLNTYEDGNLVTIFVDKTRQNIVQISIEIIKYLELFSLYTAHFDLIRINEHIDMKRKRSV
jgi:hypothetical protein